MQHRTLARLGSVRSRAGAPMKGRDAVNPRCVRCGKVTDDLYFRTCQECNEREVRQGQDRDEALIQRGRDEMAEEVRRLRAALEEISEGVGCDAKYGPGCDKRCKYLAIGAMYPEPHDPPFGKVEER